MNRLTAARRRARLSSIGSASSTGLSIRAVETSATDRVYWIQPLGECRVRGLTPERFPALT